jgi:hypothetical protein
MRTGPDFRQILDGKLDDAGFARTARPEHRAAGGGTQPAPRPVFLFGDIRSGFTAGPGRPAPTSGAPAWTPVYGARPGAQSRPARRLTPAERRALDTLCALGAGALGDHFTDAELKSAFRELARRFHPDRHPGSSDAERARLSREFASACEAYRTLTTQIH